MTKNKKLALKLGIQLTYQILKKDDEVCLPSLSSILLAVCNIHDCGFSFNILSQYTNVSRDYKGTHL